MSQGKNTLYRLPGGQTSSLSQCPLSGLSLSTSKAGTEPYTEPKPTSVKKFFIKGHYVLYMVISSHPNNPIRWVLLSLQMRKLKFQNLKPLHEDRTASK